MSIKLLVAGGTIDKQYDELTGNVIFAQTHIPELLTQARCTAPVTIETVFLKDSLDMTLEDRQALYIQANLAQEDKILITHGTDTMGETARYLGERHLQKTIVLLGAMIPYCFKQSDSLFNLGFALASVQCLPHGVYVAMNGQVFTWDNVVKNKLKGVFERG
ncbi:asparaginase domain-containing protein [Beggiatoa leptomitoformis]|uniref:asparaginase domain-containing protein n=1 Tax=Beggiatoa leptomitoformis TaxID=288004 RepID=UPI0007067DA2|nr:asparaginase domain-containing protein [Beggiatoa leptomitoformis]